MINDTTLNSKGGNTAFFNAYKGELMDNTISFTVNQLIGFVTTVGGCIVVIEAVVLIVFKLISKVKAPEVEQNNRIKALEEENKNRQRKAKKPKRRKKLTSRKKKSRLSVMIQISRR